jgi:TPR repeat protein
MPIEQAGAPLDFHLLCSPMVVHSHLEGSMSQSISKTCSPTRAPRWWPIAVAVMLATAAVVMGSVLTPAAAQQACGDAQSCQKACGAGDQTGCVQLGKLLQDGKGVPKDPARAHNLFVVACQKGEARGCLEAGMDLFDGTGVAKNAPAAAAQVVKSCELGYAMGCFMVGQQAEEGNGVPKNRAAALSAYQKGCDMGAPAGCTFAGRLHLEDKNTAKAIALFEQGCTGRHGRGCMLLGYRYYDGDGVGKDLKRAAELFKRGCELNDGFSCYALANSYYYGEGIDEDEDEGKRLYDAACKKNVEASCKQLQKIADAEAKAAKEAREAKPQEGKHCSGFGSWGITCGGRCVDSYRSNVHCGACNNECYTGTRCDVGMCRR